MSRTKSNVQLDSRRKSRPGLTPEEREAQLIALAYDRAEEQLLNGTASSQVISHFLKMGASKNQLETEKLRNENELLKARTEEIKAAKVSQELYAEAISAFRRYSGQQYDDEIEE